MRRNLSLSLSIATFFSIAVSGCKGPGSATVSDTTSESDVSQPTDPSGKTAKIEGVAGRRTDPPAAFMAVDRENPIVVVYLSELDATKTYSVTLQSSTHPLSTTCSKTYQANQNNLVIEGCLLEPGSYKVALNDQTGQTVSKSFSVKEVVISLAKNPGALSRHSSAWFSVKSARAFNQTNYSFKYECSIDGAEFTDCPSDPSQLDNASLRIDNLSPGEHELRIREVGTFSYASVTLYSNVLTHRWQVGMGSSGQLFGLSFPFDKSSSYGIHDIKNLGDTNGDGLDDYLICHRDKTGLWSSQRVSGYDGSILLNAQENLCSYVYRYWDHNGDGFDDVLLTLSDRVQITSGKDAALLMERLYSDILTDTGEQADWWGKAFAVSDINSDGKSDILLHARNGISSDNFVVGLSGSDGSVILHVASSVVGNLESSLINVDFAQAGDWDRDGVQDFLLGTASFRERTGLISGYDRGAVFVYSGKTREVIDVFYGSGDREVGKLVAGGEDFNGDGTLDIAYVESRDSGGHVGIRVISGEDGSTLYSEAFDQIGYNGSLDLKMFDYNEDGFGDLVVSGHRGADTNKNSVAVISGKDKSLLFEHTPNLGITHAGFELGNNNNDNHLDLVIPTTSQSGTGGTENSLLIKW